MARKRDYPIIRFLISSFYALGAVSLLGGLSAAAYLWIRAEALRDGVLVGGPLAGALNAYNPAELCLGAAAAAGGGLVAFLVLGAAGQVLAMQRDRAINASLQVQLLEDILELNEEAARASEAHGSRSNSARAAAGSARCTASTPASGSAATAGASSGRREIHHSDMQARRAGPMASYPETSCGPFPLSACSLGRAAALLFEMG